MKWSTIARLCLFVPTTFLLIQYCVLLSRQARKTSSPQDGVTYLSLVPNGGRLGNQLWSIVSGWGMARRTGRRLYKTPPTLMESFLMFPDYNETIEKTFPRMKEMYDVLWFPSDELTLQHNYVDGGINCCKYQDPLHHQDVPSRFIRLDSPYAQNARYFYAYREDLRPFLEFSREVKENGRKFMERHEIGQYDSFVCAHVRRTDFEPINWTTDEGIIRKMIGYVTERENMSRLFLFGDDPLFMIRLKHDLISKGTVSNNSLVSHESPSVDLFLSSRLCNSFIITSQMSTFGFWLAYLSREPHNVYYLQETDERKPHYDEQFPLPWKELKVDGNVTIVDN